MYLLIGSAEEGTKAVTVCGVYSSFKKSSEEAKNLNTPYDIVKVDIDEPILDQYGLFESLGYGQKVREA